MKRIFTVFLVFLLCLSCVACGNKSKREPEATDFYNLYPDDATQTYTYTFSNQKGKVIYKQENSVHEPYLKKLTPEIYELLILPDVNLSENWAVYCDVKNSKVSETFYYVLESVDNYVIYATTKDNARYVVVQQIFDRGEGLYRQEYKLENATPDISDFISECTLQDKAVKIRYLIGNPATVTTLTIDLP